MAGDEEMRMDEAASDSAGELEKQRIQFLKSALNVYRARNISLNSACESRMSDMVVPDHVKNHEFLKGQISDLQNDVTLLRALQDSVNTIQNTITSLSINNLNDVNAVRDLGRKVREVTFFSKSIMALYEEKINEIENIKRKQDYSSALISYKKNLNALEEQQRHQSQTTEDIRRLQKAEIQVSKINFMREMKLILIGKFGGNSEELPGLQQFRTPFRKNLTVDDFCQTWDVGLC